MKLSFLFVRNPLLILPTLRATSKTMAICNELFGKAHHFSNIANAFRHALWNILICQNTVKITKNDAKSVIWAQKFTNLYEKVTKNEILDEEMDLHNNEIGRNVFLAQNGLNDENLIAFLSEMSQKAIKIDKTEDLKKIENKLVYIV